MPAIRFLRMIVTTTDGKKSEIYVPVSSTRAGERGWRSVAIPLAAVAGLDRTNKTIKDVGFRRDATSTFYVGDLRVINDTTPLRGDIRGPRNPTCSSDRSTSSAPPATGVRAS